MDAVHTGELGLATADDTTLLDRGRAEGRIIVTLDADFHRLMALSGAAESSVIRIRIEGLKGDALAELLRAVLGTCADDLVHGALVSV